MIGTRRWLDCVTATQVLLPGSCLQAVPMNQSGHWMGQFDGFGTIEFDGFLARKHADEPGGRRADTLSHQPPKPISNRSGTTPASAGMSTRPMGTCANCSTLSNAPWRTRGSAGPARRSAPATASSPPVHTPCTTRSPPRASSMSCASCTSAWTSTATSDLRWCRRATWRALLAPRSSSSTPPARRCRHRRHACSA
jgi:hypothetical protein